MWRIIQAEPQLQLRQIAQTETLIILHSYDQINDCFIISLKSFWELQVLVVSGYFSRSSRRYFSYSRRLLNIISSFWNFFLHSFLNFNFPKVGESFLWVSNYSCTMVNIESVRLGVYSTHPFSRIIHVLFSLFVWKFVSYSSTHFYTKLIIRL